MYISLSFCATHFPSINSNGRRNNFIIDSLLKTWVFEPNVCECVCVCLRDRVRTKWEFNNSQLNGDFRE